MKTITLAMLFQIVLILPVLAADKPALNGMDDEISYSVGHQVGRDLMRQQVKVNPEVLLQGIMDATSGSEPMLESGKMVDVLSQFREKIIKLAEEKNTANHMMGKSFLAKNAENKDVVTLDNGLQYKVLTPGKGKQPSSESIVKVTYTGQNLQGKVFDSSTKDGVETPVEFKVGDVIPGWQEALTRMPEGAEWELYIPYTLAFRDTGPMAGQTVIYQVKLLDVKP